jgi:diguanylate cyclase (GGDEF)-like protein
VTARDGLPINAISSALEDRDGALWIGLAGAGLVRWAWRGRFLGWTSEEGLPDDGVWGAYRDAAGRLWVGTNNGVGIWLPDERAWKVLERKDGLAGYSVWKFAVGQDGRVWSISRRAGLNRYDPETLEPEGVALPEQFGGNPWELEAAPDRALWVGGKGFLLKIREGESGPVFEEVELPSRVTGVIESISFGAHGTVWVSGRDGLLRYDGAAWKHFGTDDGLLSNRIMNVAAASGDEVWIGYEEAKGVSRMVLAGGKPELIHFRRPQGLLSDTVWMLERDPLGRIWAGGSDGVSVILPDGSVRSYDQGDGLIWNDIAQAGFWMEPDGSVFIGTARGLAFHDPAADKALDVPPNVVITSATLGGKESIGEAAVEVGYGQGTFTARFSGLTFRNPSQVLFKYQLVGLDTEPVVTKLREVRYPALGAGSYRFEVLCRSAAGIWSPEPAVVAFTVLPAWWERWWFRLGVVLVVLLVVLSILQLRTRRLAADRRRLEVAVAERSAQLAEANRELRELSFTDVLTRVRNRRFFASTIRDTVATALRRHDPRTEGSPERNRDLVFFIVDLDHFKKVNDVHGHMVGDRVLVETARRLEGALRESDLVVRWGGEEFLLVCRDTERAKAPAVARRILELVGGTPLVNELGLRIQRTCSAGWAAMPAYLRHPEELSHEVVLEIADMALYLAKQSGRNQAVGVELVEDEFSRGRGLEWLDQSLEEVEGDLVRLTRVEGPRVSLDPITAVSPIAAPWRRKSKVPDEEGEG